MVSLRCSMGCGVNGSHSEGDAFCWKCGAPLEKWATVCPKCQKRGSACNNFCPACGTKTDEIKLPWKGDGDGEKQG